MIYYSHNMVSGYSQQPLLKSADVARYLALGAVMLLCGNRGKIWTTGIILKLFFFMALEVSIWEKWHLILYQRKC